LGALSNAIMVALDTDRSKAIDVRDPLQEAYEQFAARAEELVA
jgi:hypothetical protein